MENRVLFKNMVGDLIAKPSEAKVLPRESAYGIHVADGRVLMVLPTWSSKWELPGGRLEIGETPQQGMTREFLEETGYSIGAETPVSLGSKQEWFYNDLEKTYHDSTMHFFKVESIEKRGEVVSIEEVEAIEWVPLDQLNKVNCNASLLPFILQA